MEGKGEDGGVSGDRLRAVLRGGMGDLLVVFLKT
jgi:hypothetical protein